MSPRNRLALILICCLVGSASRGQSITPPSVQKQLQALQTADVPDDDKAVLTGFYEQALAELKTAKKQEERAERFAASARTAPEDIGGVRYELSVLAGSAPEVIAAEARLEQLEERLAEVEAELAQRQSELERLNDEPKRRAARRREIPKQRVAIKKELERLERSLRNTASDDDPPQLAEAKRIQWEAKKRALELTLSAGDRELEAYQATIDLLPLQRDLVALRVTRLQQQAKELDSILKRRRRSEVASHLARVNADVAATVGSPLLAKRAEANSALVQRRRALREESELVAQDLAATNAVLASLEQQRTRIESKIDAVGLTGAIGLLLRKQKSQLPRVADYELEVRKRQQSLRASQLAALELEDRRADLADVDGVVASIRQAAEQSGEPLPTDDEFKALRRLLADERRYTDYLIEDSNSYVDQLLQLDQAQRQLISEATRFGAFIDENVLWVRSAETLAAADFPAAAQTLGQFTGNGILRETWASLREDASRHAILYGIVAIALLFARFLGWRMTIQHARPHPIEERPSRLGRLLRDMIRVSLCAAPLPLLIGFIGLRLSASPSPQGYSAAVGVGLSTVAVSFLPLAILMRMCRRRGFARRHLGWSAKGTVAIRWMLGVLIVVVLPLTFVTSTLDALDNVLWQDSLGRLCFIANVLLVAVFIERFLRPKTGVLFKTLNPGGEDILTRLRWPAYLLGVGVHFALAALAAVGYTYAAGRLGQEVRATALLAAILLVVGSLLVRWSRLVTRRKAIQEIARRRKAEAAATAEQATPGEMEFPRSDTGDAWFVNAEPVDNKIRSLVTTLLVLTGVVGFWLIWVDVIPAFNVVNRVVLWRTEVAELQAPPPTSGQPTLLTPVGKPSPGDAPVAVPVLAPVTLGDVLLAAFILAGTVFATRYLAGLFDLPVLDRLPLDAALRNSITTVTRYTLWIVAVIVAAGFLGISWGKVQWMAAAISLGLGFGLQEIFANFISGLIILFERPMRVGDVITIGDTTGVVQAIRMRATTITDWDRKELVVPNKEFATGRLLNWTLTNKTNRRVIEVGVAYGTDPDIVRDLLLRVAAENERVLDAPKPIALLKEFGENSLIFSLRVYHARISDRLRGLHEINAAIAREFAAAGITIAFPQRDLHIRTVNKDPRINWFGPEEEEEPEASTENGEC